jgi:hypothetical protein
MFFARHSRESGNPVTFGISGLPVHRNRQANHGLASAL